MNNLFSIYPRLSSLALAGKLVHIPQPKQAQSILSRQELQRLIADMVD